VDFRVNGDAGENRVNRGVRLFRAIHFLITINFVNAIPFHCKIRHVEEAVDRACSQLWFSAHD